MTKKITYIDPKALAEAMCQSTYFKYIDGQHLYTPPYDIDPPGGFEREINFPDCCKLHRQLYKTAKEEFAKFPYCCASHIELSKKIDFDLRHYKNFPDRLMDVISYTEYHIVSQINKEDWYKEITDYIHHCWESLGHPPTLTGIYFTYLKYYFDHPPKGKIITNDKKQKLISFVNNILEPEKKEMPDINLLYDTYRKWLKIFPFHLSFFEGLKGRFEKAIPIFASEPILNKYTGLSGAQIVTHDKLLDFIFTLTKDVLNLVNTKELYDDGKITDFARQEIDFINATHDIKIKSLLGDYTKGELKYLNTIKKWLAYEKEYYKELLTSLARKPSHTEQTKSEKLREILYKYGFLKLQKVEDLIETQKESLFKKLADGNLPYQIAMLDFLGYFEYLLNNHLNSKYQIYKSFDGLLKGDERAIKGNFTSLSPISKERERKRFTAYKYKEAVEKDYNALK